MPHKVNPKHVVHLISTAAQLRGKVAPALEAGLPSHEGDAASNQLMSATLESACTLGWDLASRLSTTLSRIDIHPDAMRRNLGLSSEVIASENLMMVLALKIGRTRAHDLVHHAVAEAVGRNTPVIATLLAAPEVGAAISREELEAALAPESYLGDSALIARKAAILAAELARGLSDRAVVLA
ncbi:MAG: hypothetical protein CML24_07840 [Rhizobiales bacterium]|nr:hypothetical protein [Hyphomicrobiales bacterium]